MNPQAKRMIFVTGYGGFVDLYPPALGDVFRRLRYEVGFFAYQSGVQIRRVYQRYDYFNFASPPLIGHRWNPVNWAFNRWLVRRVARERTDLVLVGKGETLLPGTIADIRRLGAVTVNMSTDDAFGRHHPRNRLNNLEEYDLVFNFDREPCERMRGMGLRAHYLPNSAPDCFKPDPGVPKRYPISFIGQYQPKREEFLKGLVPLGLTVWGNDWRRRCRSTALRRAHRKEFSREQRLIELYQASRMTVNIHDIQSIQSTNFRIFEALGCGTFVLNEHTDELANLFEIGKEVVTFRTPDELLEKARYYLAHPEEAQTIAEAGRRRVDAEHRLFHRIRMIDRTVQEYAAERRSAP